MNNREVMQQALEAIRIFREWETGQDYESCRATVLARALAAEESLGTALAEFGADPQNVGQTQTESKQEPVAWIVPPHGEIKVNPICKFKLPSQLLNWKIPLYAHPAPQHQSLTEEPVAKVVLMTTGGNAGLATRIVEIDDPLRERLRPGQMLYTHPAPQRQPLSLKEVERLIYEHTKINPNVADDRELLGYIVNAVRAIERAHGIGGQDE